MGIPIHRRVDFDKLAFKRAAWETRDPNFDWLSYLKECAVAFRNVPDHPFGRNIGNRVRRRRLSRFHLKPRRSINRRYLARDRTANREFPFPWAANSIKRLSLLNLITKLRQRVDDFS